MKWAYGVTTVPARRRDTLPRTLVSMCEAGFPAPRLFVDGGYDPAEYYPRFDCPTTLRFPPVGVTGNWLLSMTELYARDPNAHRYLLFQDDLICVKGLREYLEHLPFPPDGYLNLYTFRENDTLVAGKPPGLYQTEVRPDGYQKGRGAVALLFTNEGARAVLTHSHLYEKLKADDGYRRVDGGVVSAMNKAGFREYVHNPSLVQHVGHVSTIGNHNQLQAKTFPGETFDARTLIG